MEIREVSIYNKKAPFTGYGIWLVFELKYRKILIVHPVTLTEIVLSEYDYVKSSGGSLWPYNTTSSSFNFERFRQSFKERIRHKITKGIPFSFETITKVIAALDDVSITEAGKYLKSLSDKSFDEGYSKTIEFDKESRSYQLRKGVDISQFSGRPLAILEAFKENGPSSRYQITELVAGKMRTKMKIGRVVTYFINKLTSQGILEIVA